MSENDGAVGASTASSDAALLPAPAYAARTPVEGTMVLLPVAGPSWSIATATSLRFRGFELAGTADLGSFGTWQVATDEQATLQLPDFTTGSVQRRFTMASRDTSCVGTFHVSMDLVDSGSGRLSAVCDDGSELVGTSRDVSASFDDGHLVQVTRELSGAAVFRG